MTNEASESKVEVFNPLDQALKTENIDIAKVQAEILEMEEKTTVKKPEKKSAVKEEVVSEDESNDEAEETTEEVTDEETTDEVDEPEEKPKKKESAKEAPVFSEEYRQAKQEMKQYANKIQEIIEDVEVTKPEKPKDENDIEAMESYEEDMKEYRRESLKANKRIERLKESIKDKARLAQDEFVKAHKNEDLTGFQNFMLKKPTYLAEFLSGEEDLEFFHRIYKLKNGDEKFSQIKKISKGGKKPIDLGTGGTPNSQGGNGLPAKYTYANKPVFSEWVSELKADMRAGKKMIDGKAITNDLIEALCEQEFKHLPPKLRNG